jgi:hypothetical protein
MMDDLNEENSWFAHPLSPYEPERTGSVSDDDEEEQDDD